MSRNIYTTDGEYILSPITEEDHENYIELHRQLNGDKTLFLNPYCKDIMWKQILEGKDKVFSIFDWKGDYCGSIELQHPEAAIPEIGIDLLENKRNKGIGPKIVVMLAKKAYQNRPVEYYLIRISSKNSHSKHVFEKLGAFLLRITNTSDIFRNNLKKHTEVFGDDTQIKPMIDFGESKWPNKETIYEYKLIPNYK